MGEIRKLERAILLDEIVGPLKNNLLELAIQTIASKERIDCSLFQIIKFCIKEDSRNSFREVVDNDDQVMFLMEYAIIFGSDNLFSQNELGDLETSLGKMDVETKKILTILNAAILFGRNDVARTLCNILIGKQSLFSSAPCPLRFRTVLKKHSSKLFQIDCRWAPTIFEKIHPLCMACLTLNYRIIPHLIDEEAIHNFREV